MASGRNGRRGRYGGGAPVNKAAGGTGPGGEADANETDAKKEAAGKVASDFMRITADCGSIDYAVS